MDRHESFFNQNETETGIGRCKVSILLSYNKPIGVGGRFQLVYSHSL